MIMTFKIVNLLMSNIAMDDMEIILGLIALILTQVSVFQAYVLWATSSILKEKLVRQGNRSTLK